jgi:hypothetical protein
MVMVVIITASLIIVKVLFITIPTILVISSLLAETMGIATEISTVSITIRGIIGDIDSCVSIGNYIDRV